MPGEHSSKTDAEQQMWLLLNDAQRFILHVRPSSIINNTIDITAISAVDDDADRPDPLRLPEVIIVICVLLLWCCSILVFIRHSELLRIRHRDLPYRPSVKAPMNLNHVTVVNRTSEMVIHSKPRLMSTTGRSISPLLIENDERTDEEKRRSSHQVSLVHPTEKIYLKENRAFSVASTGDRQTEDLINPELISSEVRQTLLDLHGRSIENLTGIRYSISFSANDVSKAPTSNNELRVKFEDRFVQESPV